MLQGLTLLPIAWTWLAPFWRAVGPVCLLLLLVQLMAPSHGPVDQA
jgi:hypothetical protein